MNTHEKDYYDSYCTLDAILTGLEHDHISAEELADILCRDGCGRYSLEKLKAATEKAIEIQQPKVIY